MCPGSFASFSREINKALCLFKVKSGISTNLMAQPYSTLGIHFSQEILS